MKFDGQLDDTLQISSKCKFYVLSSIRRALRAQFENLESRTRGVSLADREIPLLRSSALFEVL